MFADATTAYDYIHSLRLKWKKYLPVWPFWPLNFKHPWHDNVIKIDHFWWHNQHLREVLHQKLGINSVGRQHMLGDMPPKMPHFTRPHSKRPEIRPQCSIPWNLEDFKKSLHAILVLCLGYNPRERNNASFQYSRCPIQKPKTVVFGQHWVVFWVLGLVGRAQKLLGRGIISLHYLLELFQNYVCKGFWKSLKSSRDMGVFLQAFWEKNNSTVNFERTDLKIRGLNSALQKN